MTRSDDVLQFCSFRLAGRLFGVDILDVKEITSELRIAKVSHAADEIAGYLNLRGQVHLVVDLRRVFRLAPAEPGEFSRILIFKPSVDEPFGILVDATDEVVTIASGQVEERRHAGEVLPAEMAERRKAHPDLTGGVCRLDKELMVILNARGILPVILENESHIKEIAC